MRLLGKLFQFIFWLCTGLLGLALQAWAAGAIYFCSFPDRPFLSTVLAIAYFLIILGWIVLSRKRGRALLLSLIPFLFVAVWFSTIKPKTDAIYPDDLAMPSVEFKGDTFTIHNLRNNNYRTKDDFDVVYESRTYDLNELETLDVLVNFWGMKAVAHTLLSFGFEGEDYLTVSIEYRPEVGESYGVFNGLFKQYELIYIWADERDLVLLRTAHKGEDVYLYRYTLSKEQIRKLLISMLERTQSLSENPEFYNTIRQNCTNTIGNHAIETEIVDFPFWKRRILTGSVDKRMYNEGLLRGKEPFEELKRKSKINQRANAAAQDSDFSEKIRTHL